MLAVLTRHSYALALTAAAASWGIATVIAKRAVAEIPPLTLLPIQLSVSAGILAVLLRFQHDRVEWSPEVRRLGALGVLNPGISYALSLFGLTYITASLSVLLWATEPIMILALAWWILGDRISTPVAAAAGVALGGVVLVVFETGSHGQRVGVYLTLAGVAGCAVYTVVSRKWMADESTLQILTVQQLCALVFAVLLLGGVTLIGRSEPLGNVSIEAWISAVASGILYYATAFWFYLTGLRRIPAAVAGLFINLIPVFGITAAHIFLAERLALRQWLGALVILLSVGLIGVRQSSAVSAGRRKHRT